MAGITPGSLPGPADRIKEEFEAQEESLDPEGSSSTFNTVYIKEEPNIKEEPEGYGQVNESVPVDTGQYCSERGLELHPSKRRYNIKVEPEEHNHNLNFTQIDTGQNYSGRLQHDSSNCGDETTPSTFSDDTSLPYGHRHPTETSGSGILPTPKQLPANAIDSHCLLRLQPASGHPNLIQGQQCIVDPRNLYTRKDKREEALVPVNSTESDEDYSDDDEYEESDDEHEILITDSDSDDIEVLGTHYPIDSQHFTTEPPYKKLREAELVTLDYSDDSPDELPDGSFVPTTIWKRRKNSCVPQSLKALSFKHPHHKEGKNADGEISKETRGAIIALHYEGLSNGEVARWTGMTKPTVVKWIKYYEENGTTEDEYDLPIPKRSEENQQKGISNMSDENKQSDTMQGKNNNETSLETRGAIIALHHFGLTNAEVARRTGVTKPTVANWIKRYKTTGTTVDQPRMGRPRCTTSQQDEAIAAAVEANPFSSAVEIQKQLNIPCALQTIRNRLMAKQRQGCTTAEKQEQNNQIAEQ
ncbi:uncharacterized protein LOC143031213 [Oratosquilla oratoria]|uniref:uncharacterized protein LOC143031213 n=1 Tax=Oratosquilla oratoria TaxID=337810 RepID=UPI003F7660C5